MMASFGADFTTARDPVIYALATAGESGVANLLTLSKGNERSPMVLTGAKVDADHHEEAAGSGLRGSRGRMSGGVKSRPEKKASWTLFFAVPGVTFPFDPIRL